MKKTRVVNSKRQRVIYEIGIPKKDDEAEKEAQQDKFSIAKQKERETKIEEKQQYTAFNAEKKECQ